MSDENNNFVTTNGTVTRADGAVTKITVPQSAYVAYAGQHGVEKETFAAIAAVDKGILAETSAALATVLAEDIAEARKAGEDGRDTTADFAIYRPNGMGSYVGTMSAAKATRNPKTGETGVKYAGLSIRVKTNTLQDKDVLTAAAETIKAALG